MTTYTGSGNFSSGGTTAYRLDVTVVTTAVTGGTQLDISASAVFFNSNGGAISPAYSSNGTKGYSVPGGRTSSVTGTLTESGSNVNWTYDFRSSTTQTVWSGFTRFVASGYGSSTSVTINATGSGSTFLGTASVTVNVPLATSYTYTIGYSANGGSGTMTNSSATSTSTSYNLATKANEFTRSGYDFAGWNTAANGSGTSYSAGSSVALTSSSPTVLLYAQWTPQIPDPVWSNGVDAWSTIRVGWSLSDYFYASNTASYTLSAPAGLSLTSYINSSTGVYLTGTISNTTTPVTTSITVTANGLNGNSVNSTRTGISLRAALPEWTDITLADARVGTAYTSGNSFSATGATSWSISTLPPGLSASGTTTSTVTISGTPTTAGTYYITATPYNRDGTTANDAGTQQTITLVVLPRVPVWNDQVLSTTAKVGEYYSDTISVNYVTSWNDGELPIAGLSFSGTTTATGTGIGTVSGTPTSYGTKVFTITPSNSSGENPGGVQFTINVADADLAWASQTLDALTVTEGDSYSSTGVSVASGPVSVTYSVTPGYSLPDGISINPSTGELYTSGTVTAVPDTYTFKIRATNGTGSTLDTSLLSLTVEALGGYVQVLTESGWVNATVYVNTDGGWVEGTVNARGSGGWGPSFTS